MALEKLEDLNRYITILIVDDERDIRESLQLALEQEGYENVWAVEKAEQALGRLSKTNILLADYHLPTSEMKDGIALVREAKETYGEKIEAIVFSGKLDEADMIRQKAVEAQAAAFLEKPVRTDHIKLWIEELGKRIWLQQILDSDPEEVIIMDETGTLLFVDKEKEKIFGKNLVGDKCFLRFEKRPPYNDICYGCPGARTYDENRVVRTEWDYKTRGDIQNHKVHQTDQTIELISAPLRDRQGKPRAIIEIGRDITRQKAAERTIAEMEKTKDWEKRKKLFMDGFEKLGCPRVRLYLRDQREGRDEFRMVDKRGEYPPDFKDIRFPLEDDGATQRIVLMRKPLIFSIDKQSRDRDYERDSIITSLYWVGVNKAHDAETLKREEWIEIPLIAGGEVIGQVSVDGWKPKETPDSYDIEVLGRYGASAGQIIQNARNRRDIERRARTEQAILEISREITNIAKSDVLLKNAVRLACETMQTGMCSIFLLDDESGKLERRQSYGKSIRYGKSIHGNVLTEDDFYPESYGPGQYLTRRIFDEGKAQYINAKELQNMVRMEREGKTKGAILLPGIRHYAKALGEPLRNCLFVPLVVGENEMGLLRAANKLRSNDFGDRDFDQNDLEMFELLAGQIAVAIHNERLQKEKEKVFEDVAHAMFQPLKSMMLYSTMLIDGQVRDKQRIENYHKTIARSTRHLYNLTSQILNLSRKDAGTLKLLKRRVGLTDFVQDLIERNQSAIDAKSLRITVKPDSLASIAVYVDRDRAFDAFQAIFDNAIRVAKAGGDIRMEIAAVEDSVVISVQDYGPGIPEEEQKRIWDRYYQGEQKGELGIGLTATKEFVELHGGKAWVESELGKGSTFFIALPKYSRGGD